MSGNSPDEAAAGSRRPIAARDSGFARSLARLALRTSISPNQISSASVGFAAIGAMALIAAPAAPLLYIVAILGVQLRLLCNLLDGMVAVEGGRGSALGPLFNEFPDRIADSLLIVALGYAADAPSVGWAAALLAALTAYVRAFGGALGLPQDFRGPMAKQHRMAVLTAACAIALIEAYAHGASHALRIAVWIVAAGSLATCVARTMEIARRLQEK
ncbi:MAG: CDP-diacylglycerol--glycerol-3-phosphate 3-phosphatidyltransferase [Methylocystaceae bacterium]|nr:MAG: CDP-diacylglycerol--glycerol-3-phosphate 3-phosphatidyltransferase [Methylocystaceae bacterium]